MVAIMVCPLGNPASMRAASDHPGRSLLNIIFNSVLTKMPPGTANTIAKSQYHKRRHTKTTTMLTQTRLIAAVSASANAQSIPSVKRDVVWVRNHSDTPSSI